MNGNTPWRTTRGSRLLALAEGQNHWYKIRNEAGGPAVVTIYDEIGFFGVKASDLISELQAIDGPLQVRLNSPGGEVNEGLAIYNCLMARDDVDIYVDGIAASIASVIAMAGDRIFIAPSAQMMVHNPFAGVIGDADDFRAMADQLDENRDNIAKIYAARTGSTPEHWTSVMKATGWYRGQEAIDAGLADELTELKAKGKAALAASATRFNLDLLYSPSTVAAHVGVGTVKDAAAHGYVSDRDTHHEPMTGTHSHNHAAFEADDHDDGIHHHSHTHSGDAVHGHTHTMHSHTHEGYADHPHRHAHNEGQERYGGNHSHRHAHHGDPDHDGDDDTTAAGDTDHDYVMPDGSPGPKAAMCYQVNGVIWNKNYSKADRDEMAASGEAMEDGSYPIRDEEDLDNAIKAVGRGGSSHDAIRKHIIKRARALKKESKIPDNWNSDGTQKTAATDSATTVIRDKAWIEVDDDELETIMANLKGVQ